MISHTIFFSLLLLFFCTEPLSCAARWAGESTLLAAWQQPDHAPFGPEALLRATQGLSQQEESTQAAAGKTGPMLYLSVLTAACLEKRRCCAAPSASHRECVCVHMYTHRGSPVHTLILLKQQEEQSACC